jgi:phage-related minor tail protein
MHYRNIATIGIVGLALAGGACNRDAVESRETTAREERTPNVDRTAELQRERDDEISGLEKRVADIERDYAQANQKVVSGDRTATAGLREELKEDVTNIKTAVGELRTTTPDNWWDRQEEAMTETADDIEADVSRLAGKITPTPPQATSRTTGENVSTAPFTSRRDKFVAGLSARADAMEQALDEVKARGPQETEIEDTRARVKKLADDVERLRSASADDWWGVTKARVSEYVDRVEASVKRLDDNKS